MVRPHSKEMQIRNTIRNHLSIVNGLENLFLIMFVVGELAVGKKIKNLTETIYSRTAGNTPSAKHFASAHRETQ